MADRADSGVRLRALAARANDAVVSDGRSLADVEPQPDLAERDQSLLLAVLNESLRWHHRYQWLLDQLLDRPLRRRDHLLAALLRIGLTQLDVLRVPDHAAVATTVSATGVLGLKHARGLTNAVLRRYLRERDALAEAMQTEPVAKYSHPDWLIASLERDWPDDWQHILTRANERAPMWLRVNRLRGSRGGYLEELAASGLTATPGPGCPDSVLLAEPCAVTSLPGFAEGRVSVQDAAAQRAAELLAPAPGMRVLDACAAPGGKTAHILECCPDLEELVAVDSDAKRLDLVAATLARLGLSATLIAADASATGDWHDGRPFDRILLDAPCSATGVIRRHPDIKLLRRPEDIPAMQSRQTALIEALWPLLNPGGNMVYVTCSVLAAENRDLTEAFVATHPEAKLATYGTEGHFQILPGEANSDGFYYACLTKAAGSDN